MPKNPITIQDLFPDLTPEEQKVAEENLRCYVEIVVRIEQRLEQEESLTHQDTADRMEDERSNHYPIVNPFHET